MNRNDKLINIPDNPAREFRDVGRDKQNVVPPDSPGGSESSGSHIGLIVFPSEKYPRDTIERIMREINVDRYFTTYSRE